MINFKTRFIPSIIDDQSDRNPNWDRVYILKEVLGDYEIAKDFIKNRIEKWQKMLVAYNDDEILGFQLLDYDNHKMAIYLGYQALSQHIKPEEKEEFSRALEEVAYNQYQQLF